MLKVATYNKPGQHMERRTGGSRDEGYGTGRDLATKPGTGMRTVLELATAHSFDVYVATETRTREEEWEAVRGAWDMAGYEIDGTCGAIKDGATSGQWAHCRRRNHSMAERDNTQKTRNNDHRNSAHTSSIDRARN